MFRKNDRTLKIVRIAMYVIIGICAVWLTIDCINLMMSSRSGVEMGLRFLFFGYLLLGGVCFILELIYSAICDIKLIRNKMYGQDNDGLSAFINENKSIGSKTDFADDLRKLKELLDAGAITEEEYNEGKKRILSEK